MNPLPESVSPLESHCHDFFASIHPVLLLARPLSSVGLSVSPSSPLVCLPPPPPARCYCTHCGYPSSPGQTNVPCYLRRGCVLQALTLLGHTLTHTHSPGWACLPRRSFASRSHVRTNSLGHPILPLRAGCFRCLFLVRFLHPCCPKFCCHSQLGQSRPSVRLGAAHHFQPHNQR